MKLIVSDFDLTFFDSNYEKNIELINSFVEKGNIFVIATGRTVELLKKEIENKNIKFKYLICSDGAIILDDNYNILKSVTFDKIMIEEIIKDLKNDNNLIKLEIDKNDWGISGIYAVFANLNYARERLQYIINKYNVSGYLSTHGINIINKNISKVDGIEYIKKSLNINENNIYTIGDNVNDLEMINNYNGYMIGKDITNFQEFLEKIQK